MVQTNTSTLAWTKRATAVVLAVALCMNNVGQATAITYDSATLTYFDIIDDFELAGYGTSIGLKFGATLDTYLRFDRSLDKFIFNNDLDVQGTVSGSALTVMAGNSYFMGRLGVGTSATPEGQLEVAGTISGSIIHAGALSVSGSFSLEQSTTLSGSTIRGFGLSTDCDTAGTSKLLWDATTGRFSCGTDQTGGSSLTAGQGLGLNGTTLSLNATITGSLLEFQTVSGALVYAERQLSTSGSTTLGEDGSDTVTFNANVGSNVVPSATETYTLGQDSNRWDNVFSQEGNFSYEVYIGGNVSANNVTARAVTNCTAALETDSNGLIVCGTDDSGMGYFNITDGATSESVSSGESVLFQDGTNIDVTVSATDTVTISLNNGYLNDVNQYLNTGSNVTFGSLDTPSGYVNVGGNVTAGAIGVNTLSPKASLEVVGILSGVTLYATKSFSGAGLSDCDTGATSKLLWDATTGRFSCGTDQTGGGSLTAGQGLGLNGTTLSLNTTITGSLVEFQTVSGATVHAQSVLRSSGTIVVENPEVWGATEEMIIADSNSSEASQVFLNNTTNHNKDSDGLYLGNYHGPAFLVNREASSLYFGTSNLARLGITANGNVGIGTEVSFYSGSEATAQTKLEVVGIMSGVTLYATQSFSGAGLSDCDNGTTSKLLWDATAGRFSCGTDQTGGGSLTAGQGLGLNGTTLSLNTTITGSLVEFQTVSGAKVFSQSLLSSSGGLTVEKSDADQNIAILSNSVSSVARLRIFNSTTGETDTDGLELRNGSQFNEAYLINHENAALHLGTNGQNRFTITDIGNIGINQAVPTTRLDVVGAISGSFIYATRSFSGAGLSDCDNATDSKLLWDATTGRFSCGTDQTGGASGGGMSYATASGIFLKRGGGTMTGTLRIQNGNSHTPTGTPLLNVLGTISGSKLQASNMLASSGAIVLRTPGVTQPTFFANGSQKVGINTASPHSSLTASGTFATTVRIATSTGSINGGDQIIFASGSSMITLTLPTAVGIAGRQYTIKKTSSTDNTNIRRVIIEGNGSETIDRLLNWKLLNRGQQVTVVSDGANWQTIDASHYGLNGGFVAMGTTMNQWYGTPSDGTALTTAALTTTATIRVLPFVAQKVMTINGMAVSVQTTAASAEVRLALYADSGRNYPDALIVDAGTVVTTSTGVRSICPSGCTTTGAGALPVTIQPGLYWIAINNNSIAHTLRGYAVANLNSLQGYPSNYTTARTFGWQVANSYGAYPTTFPTGASATTAAPLPAVTMRIQE